MQQIAKDAITLGMSLEEFDRLDILDISFVIESLAKRWEINNEGVISGLLRLNAYITAIYAPFVKPENKPKKPADLWRFSHEKSELSNIEAERAAIAAFVKQHYTNQA